ncbi:polysaccharide pyruvyl transferase family protein [Sphingobacterium sp. UT-1RO-CII-1]|uniref:polysaccharide pyruvyl transferase family protein n=1 Tax=Sphingobacterium sp. UT-1RO-CII-1 TaxID=2995225 RepID=UPI00227CCB5E|nr:polysaccharide pyruvyl transferase family protein [Sphingobacterium sp. UT-1RO-CII-1]MCY4780802.1 polysaccharide pyruvyl transferase family protein [Sphingobacterium sp. UT-1RO-CII-1]
MKKKIGILTQSLISNYGGILQNYALQRILEKLGFEVETINRTSSISDFKITIQKIKQLLLNHHNNKIVFNYQRDLIIRESQQFIKTHINKFDVVNPTNEKLQHCVIERGYDILLVGSDQVWRPKYAINLLHDFINFTDDPKIKKLAYAVSFGTNEWEYTEEQGYECSQLAKKFNAIGVREDDAVILCNNYFGITAEHVLDPTMLLEKEDYLKVIDKRGVKKRKGVFNYVLDSDEKKTNIINNIAESLETEVFNNHPKYSLENNKDIPFSYDNFGYPSIEGWLASFRDADFVITDSFHGTVFSIIFNKPFISIINKERGVSRFESLLKLFGLESRLIDSNDSFNESFLKFHYDYERINFKINELRRASLEFLSKNLR